MFKKTETKNKEIWENRYKSNVGIAKWPYDDIVSMVMQKFGAIIDKKKVNILDYGCGGGNNYRFLCEEGFNAFGCDISSSAIKHTLNLVGDEYHKNLCIIDSDEQKNLPYSDNFFDAIIDRESLCQSSFNGIKLRINDFARILKPKGYYFGIAFNDHHPDIGSASFLGNGDYDNFKKGLFFNQGRRHLFSTNEIIYLFNNWKINYLLNKKIESVISNNVEQEIKTSEFIISASTL